MTTRNAGRRVNALLALVVFSVTSATCFAALTGAVRTRDGLLEGSAGRDATVTVFKGVPFAAPPVGPLRWRPPEPSASWQGVRKADRFGDTCAQPARGEGPRAATSEDCLYLNVWTSAQSARDRQSVFVWIYGGGFMLGSASSPQFDGEALARKGVIVVTMNYRVGPFGFLATPELSAESPRHVSGNYGLLDNIAGLKWVRDNIAAFGGDPTKVTIGGQSSGAGSALLLAQSPLAKGLFRGVIAQSGARAIGDPTFVQVRTLASNEFRGTQFADEHGASSLPALRALSWQQVLEGVALNKGASGDDGDVSLPVFRPTIDGWVLPATIGDTYARGLQQDVPVLTGFNLDEMGAVPQPKATPASLRELAQRDYGTLAAELLQLYPATTDAEAGAAQNALARDRNRSTSYLWATAWKQKARSKVYTYFWTHAPPGPQGAFHGAEIRYEFNSLDLFDMPWTAEDRKVADVTSAYWANFITTGDPNGAGLPRWAAFDGTPQIMVLGGDYQPMPVATPARLDFLQRFYRAQKAW